MSSMHNGPTPEFVAAFDQLKTAANHELDRLEELTRKLAGRGHAEICLISGFYGETLDHLASSGDMQRLVALLAFSVIRNSDVTLSTGTECKH